MFAQLKKRHSPLLNYMPVLKIPNKLQTVDNFLTQETMAHHVNGKIIDGSYF